MSSENVQKGQMKMYNFGGSIFRNIHQRINKHLCCFRRISCHMRCITTGRINSPPN